MESNPIQDLAIISLTSKLPGTESCVTLMWHCEAAFAAWTWRENRFHEVRGGRRTLCVRLSRGIGKGWKCCCFELPRASFHPPAAEELPKGARWGLQRDSTRCNKPAVEAQVMLSPGRFVPRMTLAAVLVVQWSIMSFWGETFPVLVTLLWC